MTDEMPAIRKLHAAYQDSTGIPATLTMSKVSAWRAWMAMGWTTDDLYLVVRMLRNRIEDKPRLIRAMRFEWMIGDTERFDGDLSEARALSRIPKPTERDKVMAMTGRPSPVKQTAQSAAAIMAGNAAFEQFRQWRKQTGL